MRRPGFATARTALARTRTGLASAALGMLLLRLGVIRGQRVEVAAAMCALVLGATVVLVGRRGDEPAAVALVSALTVLTGVLTAVALS